MTTQKISKLAHTVYLVLSLTLLFLHSIGRAAELASPQVNAPAPEFEETNAEGKLISLKSLKGKYVVLEWFNDGCPFILKHYESGNMQRLQKKWTAQGVVWISVLSSAPGKQGHLKPEELRKLDKSWKPFRSQALFDGDGSMGTKYGASTTPHMFVINPKGQLIYKGAIDDNPSSRQEVIATSKNYVDLALTQSLAGQTVEKQETAPYGCSVKYTN